MFLAAAFALWLAFAGINMPVVPVGLDEHGALMAPADPDSAGLYTVGQNRILVGHLDWAGKRRPFAALTRASSGDSVALRDAEYVIESNDVYGLATADWLTLFAATDQPTLTMVTCAGPFDPAQGGYLNRRVVRAVH